MSDQKDEKHYKIFQGVLGHGGRVYYCYAVDKDAARRRFCDVFGAMVDPDEEIHVVETK